MQENARKAREDKEPTSKMTIRDGQDLSLASKPFSPKSQRGGARGLLEERASDRVVAGG